MTYQISENRRPGLASEIRSALQMEIETGKLPPGAPLDERALAARFNVSRTPVRDALRQLAAQDLVRIAPRQGIFVARLSIPELRSMLELLGELEALCAKLAARRCDNSHRAALGAALERCLKAAADDGSAKAYVEANAEFHEAIYSGSCNGYLAERVRAINRLAQRYRGRMFREPREIAKSMQDHQKIAEAIRAGNESAAYASMLEHTPAGTTGFSEFLSTLPAEFFEENSQAVHPGSG